MTSQCHSDVKRDWLVTYARKVARERAYIADHPRAVFCVMLREDEAEGLLAQLNELVQKDAA